MTDYTAPPTYEAVRDWWLGSSPTAGPSEKFDRKINFDRWAADHGLLPADQPHPTPEADERPSPSCHDDRCAGKPPCLACVDDDTEAGQ